MDECKSLPWIPWLMRAPPRRSRGSFTQNPSTQGRVQLLVTSSTAFVT